MTRVLTAEAETERADFKREYGHDGNCHCHLSPPCASCTHPGNPLNQDEDDSCWVDHEPALHSNSVRKGAVLMTITTPGGQSVELRGTDLRMAGHDTNRTGESVPWIEVPFSGSFEIHLTPEQQKALSEWVKTESGRDRKSLPPQPARAKKAQWKRERSKFRY